jgi:phosphomannomutase/phosphoglucomutase
MLGKGEGLKNILGGAAGGSRGSMSGFVRNSLVIVTLVGLLCGAVLYFLQDISEKERSGQEVQAAATGVANAISGQIQLYKALLTRLALDPWLEEGIKTGDRAALLAQEEVMAGLIPQASSVHLLPSDWDLPGGQRQLSFATLAMLREVRDSGKASPAEVHQFSSSRPHIAMAVPILARGTGQVLGILHLTLPMTILQQAMEAVVGRDAQVELRQLVDGEEVVLLTNEDAGQIRGNGNGGFLISGSIWKVVFQLPEVGSLPAINPVMVAVPLLGLMLIGLLMAFQVRRLKGMLQVDNDTIIKIVNRGLHGRPVKSERSRLRELQLTMDQLVDMAHHISPALEQQHKLAEAEEGVAKKDKVSPEKSKPTAVSTPSPAVANLPATIFRAYDIRGVAGSELSPELVFQLGRAIGSEAGDQGEQSMIIARDGRNSSPDITAELCRGLIASGRDVVDIGVVPTPVLYFATHFLGSSSGVMVTGSHNPPDYNGFKIVINGTTLSGEAIQGLKKRIESSNFTEGKGSRQEEDLIPDYLGRITEDVQMSRPLKVVVDCGNGVAGVIAPALLKAMGCEVEELYCEVNGNFPNHHPDPGKPENLLDLVAAVKSKQADLGIAFDGDGDRLGVVDSSGKIIWPDRLLILLARDVLSRQPGADIIYDIKSTRHLASAILSGGGRPLMWKSGHSLIKTKLQEGGAMLAGEMSGHIFFQERWYGFDDGIYAAARLLEILSTDARSSAEVFAELPESPSTPELNMPLAEDAKFALLQKMRADGGIPGAKLITIDGIRAEFERGWGLIRPSNTTPSVVFRFEADDETELQKIQQLFRERLLAIDSNLKLPF